MEVCVRGRVVAASVLFAASSALEGQSIRGVVVDAAKRPVAGVVVVMLDSASHTAARALSNEQGEFRVSGSAPGTYRIRTTRIGFRPLLSEPMTLSTGQLLTKQLSLSLIPFALDTVHAQDKSSCSMSVRDSAVATWRVWEQVRAAITAGEVTALSRGISATVVSYQRTLELSHRRITAQTASIRSEIVKQPWRSVTPERLRSAGYVGESGDYTTYSAPGLDMLSSDLFLEDHCFRLDHGQPGKLGITFEPTHERKNIAEVHGTAWLDRKTSELRTLEFRYSNVPKDIEGYAGGEMQFTRMRNGAWVISRWNIHMPVIVQVNRTGREVDTKVTELQATGGELVLVTSVASHGADTLWARQPLTLAGTVVDSSSGKSVRDAHVVLGGTTVEGTTDDRGRFTISDVMPGNYVLQVRTPSLDSVNAVRELPLVFTDSMLPFTVRVPTGKQIASTVCKDQQPSAPGIVMGLVTLRGSVSPMHNAQVEAEWTDITIDHGIDHTKKLTNARTDSTGAFTLCGLPVNTQMYISAKSDSGSSSPLAVRIPPNQRFGRADLILEADRKVMAVFTGLVLSDSTKEPIADAEVSLPSLDLSTITDAKGQFRITGITPGSQRVRVRHLGFGILDTQLDFLGDHALEQTVYLSKVTALDSMLVIGARPDPSMLLFEEHRALGIGAFVTRAQIAPKEGGSLDGIIAQLGGVLIARGTGGQSWVAGSRPPMSRCIQATNTECLRAEGLFYVPDRTDKAQGMSTRCYSAVYMDHVLMNPGHPRPPYDISYIRPEQIEAIEWYADRAHTSSDYFGPEFQCGVLVIHSRR
jgi:protocatechuate 3,4-dioxygenase beta subunit